MESIVFSDSRSEIFYFIFAPFRARFFQCLKNVFLQQLFPYGYQKSRIWSDFETVAKMEKLRPKELFTKY